MPTIVLALAAIASGAAVCEQFLAQLRTHAQAAITSDSLVEARSSLPCESSKNEICNCVGAAPDRQIAVCAAGPGGSGHFWTVHVEERVAGGKQLGYLQMVTTTSGWRHLAAYPGQNPLAPLVWLADLDGDRAPEVLIWWSATYGAASNVEQLLLVSAYQFERGELVPSKEPARPVLQKLAAVYDVLDEDGKRRAPYAAARDAIHAFMAGTDCASGSRK